MSLDHSTIMMLLVLWGLTAFVVALAVVRAMAWQRIRLAAPSLEKKNAPLTSNETEFLGRLRRALPDYEILPQVSMSALVRTSIPENHPSFWQEFDKFSRKTADYVVCEKRGLAAKLVIELDDRTHDAAKDQRRDAMLRSAGLNTLRYDSRSKPSSDEIRRDVMALLKVPLKPR